MDIEKTWQQHNPAAEELPDITSVAQLKVVNKPSPLKRMKYMLKINMLWALIISIVYVVIIYFDGYWQIRVLFGLLLLFNFWSVWRGLKLYQNINEHVTAGNLLAELKRNHLALKQWVRVQTTIALFIYPFSAAAGFLLGGVIGSGKSVEAFLSKPVVIVALVVCMIVLTPVAHWATKWLFKRSFGGLQQHLEQTIAELAGTEESN